MANKPNSTSKPNKRQPPAAGEVRYFDYQVFKARHARKPLLVAAVLLCLFLAGIFKHISYPLFWADESMTAVGAGRILEFGYPKVHDGKNVFDDFYYNDRKLGINEKDDAFIGGSGWGHYYFGTIGYKLAANTDDPYAKTALFRSTFAIAGLLGLFLFVFLICKLFDDSFTRYSFIALFLLTELISVSLALHIREVRYYALVILLSGLITGLYAVYTLYRPFNRILFTGLLSVALWSVFITFAPVYFISIMAICLAELVVAAFRWHKYDFTTAFKKSLPVLLAVVISLTGVYPLLSYFKTFEISAALRKFYGFTEAVYWDHVSQIFNYFKNHELLLLAIALKFLMLLDLKKQLAERTPLFRVSAFLSLFFIISIFAIGNIPGSMYTRYIIYMQPILSAVIILDFFILLRSYSEKSTSLLNLKSLLVTTVFLVLTLFIFLSNLSVIKTRVYELTHRYMGPLDYTIPYLKQQYTRTDTLVIATNYEETSYIYYLDCKTIIGFMRNNFDQDIKEQPHVIAHRHLWGGYADIFNYFMRAAPFKRVGFPVFDSPINNLPEINFLDWPFKHQFKTQLPTSAKDSTYLYISN